MMITTESPTKVLCVDDHAFVVEGLRARLEAEPDMKFAGSLASADNLAQEVKKTGADIVLMDIDMPGVDAFAALAEVHRQCPDTRAIMLSAYVRDHYIDAAVEAGAWGYLSKGDDPSSIIDVIRRVSKGEFAFGPEVIARCRPGHRPGRRGSDDGKPHSKLDLLTQRELEILRMIGRGMSRATIAKAIHRSAKTVDSHRISIMGKLDIHDRVELARFAIREGLIEP